MDHLSSCYFCSSALDEPLGTYTVSGTAGEKAVTLCSTCHRKLDLILDTSETVTVEAPDATRPAQPGGGTVGETDDLVRDEDASETGDDGTAVEAAADEPDAETPADGEPESVDDSAEEESGVDDPAPPAAEAADDGTEADDPLDIDDRDEDSLDTDDGDEDPSTDDADSASPGDEDPLADEGVDDAGEGLEARMEPDIPEEFGGTDADEEGSSADEPGTGISADESDTAIVDDESDAELPEENSDVDSEIDPSILQADEIATGKLDIDEALGAEPDTPADPDSAAGEPAEGAETSDSGASDEPADGPETDIRDGESGTDDADPAGDEPTDDDAGEEIDQIIGELDEEIEELGRGAGDEDSPQAGEESREDEDGGFAFDQGAAENPDEDIISEMEPDIPEEFDTGGEETDDEESDADSERIIFGADSMVRDDLADDEPEGELADDEPDDSDPEQSDEADQSRVSTEDDTADETDELEDIGAHSGGTDGSADQTDAAESESADDPDEPGTDDRPSISALEYNKVMRLLQNREFPVDREEIVTVAANAYQLSEADCLAVIDLAIDRGLLAEDGDVLVRPD